ncbi:MAG: CoA transferase [Myxococcota bacterium]
MVGIRIVDFSRVLAGPWASQHLADQGAEVWKVEPPGGDETRAFGPFWSGSPARPLGAGDPGGASTDAESTYFLSCNRNKASIVLDLQTDAGREAARDLVRSADVVLHNWRPGVDRKLGMDWDTVRAIAPRVVYVAISAFGSDDPRAGYDLVLQAMGGAMSFTGFPGQPPIRAGTPIADLVTGLLAVQAVLHGLLDRHRTGEGQRIEVNMMQAQAACLVYHLSRYTVTGEAETRRGNAHRGLVPYDVYRCADGWLAVACGNDGLWTRLRLALGLPDEPAWATNPGRVAARDAVDAAVSGALAGWTTADADRALTEAGVPVGVVLDVAGVAAHPAVRSVTVDHPAIGPVTLAGPTLRTATTRVDHTPPPRLGGDRDAILGAVGYDAVRIRDLRARGAFGGED